jgi:uncharacterized membrane protein
VDDPARAILAVIHVGSGFVFAAGYIATNLLTELARRTVEPDRLRLLLEMSDVFDARLSRIGGTFVALSGLVLVPALGHRFDEPWIVGSIVAYLLVMLLGIIYWGRRGRFVGAARECGDLDRVHTLLVERRSIVVSRLENALVVTIVVLMVLRPA